jgi:hypothetical protein
VRYIYTASTVITFQRAVIMVITIIRIANRAGGGALPVGCKHTFSLKFFTKLMLSWLSLISCLGSGSLTTDSFSDR